MAAMAVTVFLFSDGREGGGGRVLANNNDDDNENDKNKIINI